MLDVKKYFSLIKTISDLDLICRSLEVNSCTTNERYSGSPCHSNKASDYTLASVHTESMREKQF